MKCSDIPDYEILNYVGNRRIYLLNTPDIGLVSKYPLKVIMAKMEKLGKKGYLEYGVSLRTAWLTEKGKQYLNKLKEDKCNIKK